MNNVEAAPATSEDAAWACVLTPLDHLQLKAFCQDIERFFRINPFLEFTHWRQLDDNRYQVEGRNLSQIPAFEFSYELSLNPDPHGLQINYSQGLKSNTRLVIEATENGSKLTIIDDYSHQTQQYREQHLDEVDKSISHWAGDIQRFIVTWQRWSWLAPWRWYMRYIWQPLKPMGRRIVYIFMWITLVEIVLIGLGAAIYWLEYT